MAGAGVLNVIVMQNKAHAIVEDGATIVCADARGEKASTIVDLSDDIKILREGPISLDELEEALK